MGLGCGRKMVPIRLPAMTAVMRSGSAARQMTVEQPAAVAMRAAVSLVAMPPVPHCVPRVLVSTWPGKTASTWEINSQQLDRHFA